MDKETAAMFAGEIAYATTKARLDRESPTDWSPLVTAVCNKYTTFDALDGAQDFLRDAIIQCWINEKDSEWMRAKEDKEDLSFEETRKLVYLIRRINDALQTLMEKCRAELELRDDVIYVEIM
jgi:hypothetical protein